MLRVLHSGVVEEMDGERVVVRILQTSACSECRARSHCGASESKEKLVDVYGADTSRLAVGQKVDVVASSDVAMQAVRLAFGWPFLLLVAVLFAVYAATGNELTAALSAVGALVPYYLIIYIMRDRLREKMAFRIES